MRRKVKDNQVRSRAAWIELGEKSTNYFLGLEKSRQNNNVTHSLKDESGSDKLEDQAILQVARDFYADLYKSDASAREDVDHYLESVTFERSLSDLDKLECEGDISYNECELAIKSMKTNKSPGLDGICIEFYKKFLPILRNLLTDVFNQCYHDGKLTMSQRITVMSLIHKKDDKDDIANYRPISLTNVDYRILTFVLTNRLQKVIGKIINDDQTAYIKGRFMGNNVRLVSDMIDYYDILNKSGILLAIDFRKAFDSIEWNFIYKSLESLNFGPSFINWIKTIYNSPEACIKNNGHVSEVFQMSRGIRQGCSVSALLFVISVEILATKIRQCSSLNGLNFGIDEKPVKIAQYADDAVLFLNNKEELCSALNVIEEFGQLAGTKLNIGKCEGLWLGKDKHLQKNCKLFGMKWPKAMRCLGIFIGHDKERNEKLNWFDKIEKMRQSIAAWSKRDLRIYGKVQIIKSFAVSQLVHVASLIPVPSGIVKL